MTAVTDREGTTQGRGTIRRAASEDVEVLHAMLAEMAEELGAKRFLCDTDALLRYGFGDAPLFRALLAERARRALGVVLYFPEFSTLRGRPGVYVQDLYIRPEARATGLGRALLAGAARDGSEAWGAAYLRLCAHETNAGALAVYAKFGFETDPGERPLWIDGAAFLELGGIP